MSGRSAVRALVVGSGIAGLLAALHASRGGAQVTLVTKAQLGDANTWHAQGGIAGVMFDDDRVEDHLRDTLQAGAGLSEPEAVPVLVNEGPARIRELIALGVGFDRDADGALRKGLEAAHSYPRVLHAGGDATGAEIERALVAAVRASAIEVIEEAFLCDLVVGEGRVRGAQLLIGGTMRILDADAVVLATGGLGQLFAWTTNPPVATGDGIAAAIRAGADVSDLEFVQFHPTVLAAGAPFLVSEAVRGEGAVLRDAEGRRFALDAHPDGELAPRDVVARAIAQAAARQDGTPVRLDATQLGTPGTAAFLAARFPTIDGAVRERGLDWAREPIPVTPAAHYLMGGITTDLHGRTSLPGLYAVGECARTGVHGANRLASNSLLEGAVFGARAGEVLVTDADSPTWLGPFPRASVCAVRPLGTTPQAQDEVPFSRMALQQLMWDEVGLIRHATGLARAAAQVNAWRDERAKDAGIRHTVAEREDDNMLLLAQAMIAAARRRTHSVGAHFRSDDTDAAVPGSSTGSDASPAQLAEVATC